MSNDTEASPLESAILELRRLKLQPGGAFALQLKRRFCAEELRSIVRTWNEVFPGSRLVILEPDMELMALDAEDLANRRSCNDARDRPVEMQSDGGRENV